MECVSTYVYRKLPLYSGHLHFLKYPQFQLDCYLQHPKILIKIFLDQILHQDQILDRKETISSRIINYKKLIFIIGKETTWKANIPFCIHELIFPLFSRNQTYYEL